MKDLPGFSSLRVAVLGSTGSVGTQALDVIRELGCRVVLLSSRGRSPRFAEHIDEFHPEAVCLCDESAAIENDPSIAGRPNVYFGEKAHVDLVRSVDADVIIHTVSGMAGLPTAIAASEKGVRLAIANKESVISAGDIILDNIRSSGGELIPVDSEHSAVFQCLLCNRGAHEEVKRIILTASGGPFYGWSPDQLKEVTPERALEHPTWKMGPKITVDCATMMNKGFEVIEAVRLFGVEESRVDVVIHRQSIIHSMVEYTDNTVIAQLGYPDMRSPVRFALTYPHRSCLSTEGLDFSRLGSLTFAEPDNETFPLLEIARAALREGDSYPASLIAADEVAVEAFLSRAVPFDRIPYIVEKTLDKAPRIAVRRPDDVAEAYGVSTRLAREVISGSL